MKGAGRSATRRGDPTRVNSRVNERLTDALRDWDIIAAVGMIEEGERGVESGGEEGSG